MAGQAASWLLGLEPWGRWGRPATPPRLWQGPRPTSDRTAPPPLPPAGCPPAAAARRRPPPPRPTSLPPRPSPRCAGKKAGAKRDAGDKPAAKEAKKAKKEPVEAGDVEMKEQPQEDVVGSGRQAAQVRGLYRGPCDQVHCGLGRTSRAASLQEGSRPAAAMPEVPVARANVSPARRAARSPRPRLPRSCLPPRRAAQHLSINDKAVGRESKADLVEVKEEARCETEKDALKEVGVGEAWAWAGEAGVHRGSGSCCLPGCGTVVAMWRPWWGHGRPAHRAGGSLKEGARKRAESSSAHCFASRAPPLHPPNRLPLPPAPRRPRRAAAGATRCAAHGACCNSDIAWPALAFLLLGSSRALHPQPRKAQVAADEQVVEHHVD